MQFPPCSTNPFECQRIANTYFEASVKKNPNLSKQILGFSLAETKKSSEFYEEIVGRVLPVGPNGSRPFSHPR